MNITTKYVTISELMEGFVDNGDNGVFGYSGKLTIRPDYQREFVYNPEQQKAVIETVRENLPLGLMYWNKIGEDTYELLDGQQRTLSIAKFIENAFGIIEDGNDRFYTNLTSDEKEALNNYKLEIKVVEGTESEKIKWFEKINVAGVVLKKQELLNATYHGSWVEDAKGYFSKSAAGAAKYGAGYVKGVANRQDYLEKAIEWIVDRDKLGTVQKYMAEHQHDLSADPLWIYYKSVINWAKTWFPDPIDKITDAQDWGILYNKYHNNDAKYNSAEFKETMGVLRKNPDVTKKSGIIPYLFSDRTKADVRYLNIRAFEDCDKQSAYEKQEHKCAACGREFEFEDMEGDHIIPWSRGGRTEFSNLQMLCRECNNAKSNH